MKDDIEQRLQRQLVRCYPKNPDPFAVLGEWRPEKVELEMSFHSQSMSLHAKRISKTTNHANQTSKVRKLCFYARALTRPL